MGPCFLWMVSGVGFERVDRGNLRPLCYFGVGLESVEGLDIVLVDGPEE